MGIQCRAAFFQLIQLSWTMSNFVLTKYLLGIKLWGNFDKSNSSVGNWKTSQLGELVVKAWVAYERL